MAAFVGTAGQLNSVLLRPFQQRVDLLNVALVFALLLVVSGMWHIVLNHVES